MTRICCLGDSVTDGLGDPWGGYCGLLWSDLWKLPNGDVRPVGSRTRPNALQFGPHEGHPGWKIADATQAVPGIATAHSPDIWLVLLGTNDLYYGGGSLATYTQALGDMTALLCAIQTHAPGSRVLVGTIPPMAAPQVVGWWYVYNKGLPQALQAARVASCVDCRLVDTAGNLTFGPAIADEAGHLTGIGFRIVADEFYKALVPILEAA